MPAAGAVTALVTGEGFDQFGARVLLALPFLVAALPLLTFVDSGPRWWRASCFGLPSARRHQVRRVRGGAGRRSPAGRERRAGALCQYSIATLAAVVAGTQVVAAPLLLSVVLRVAQGARPQPPVPISR